MTEKFQIFLKKKKVIILLALIIVIGAFLRFYNFHDLVRFNNDQVRDSVVVDGIFEKNSFPLLGPPAASSNFKLGPAYYYLEYISAVIFGNNPAGIAYLVVILNIISIPLLFFFLRYYFSSQISLGVSFFYGVSFFMIKYSKFSWNPNVITFFFLVFLISLFKIFENKFEKNTRWLILAGISMGIGFQLHTFLIFIMPVLLVFFWLFTYLKEKKKEILRFILIIFIAIVLNSTVIAFDLNNNGKNFKAFFSVANEKTTEEFSLVGNFIKGSQFFIQENIYVLSAFELRDSWLDANISLKNKVIQSVVAFLGWLFFIFCLIRILINFKGEKNDRKKLFLGIILISTIFPFLLFLIVASMLKARFFVAIFFVPFVFLGILLEFLNNNFNKRIFLAILFLIMIIFVSYNLIVYQRAYNLENYSSKSDLYGGISLREAKDISKFMVDFSKKENLGSKKLYLDNFEFAQSVNYLNEKAGLKTNVLKNRKKIETEFILFKVSKSKNKEQSIKEDENFYKFVESENFGRFSVFIFKNKI